MGLIFMLGMKIRLVSLRLGIVPYSIVDTQVQIRCVGFSGFNLKFSSFLQTLGPTLNIPKPYTILHPTP